MIPQQTGTLPTATTFVIELPAPFTGWAAECRSARNLPARLFGDFAALADATGGDTISAMARLMEQIVVEHNFPDALTGERAASLLDCTPEAIAALAEAWTEKATTADPR